MDKGFVAMSIEMERACMWGRRQCARFQKFVRNGMAAYLTYDTRSLHRVQYYVKGSAEKTVDVLTLRHDFAYVNLT